MDEQPGRGGVREGAGNGTSDFWARKNAKAERLRGLAASRVASPVPAAPPAPAAPVGAPTLSSTGESHLAHFPATNEFLLFPLFIVIVHLHSD